MVAFVQQPGAGAKVASERIFAGPDIINRIAGQMVAVGLAPDQAVAFNSAPSACYLTRSLERIRESESRPTQVASDLRRSGLAFR